MSVIENTNGEAYITTHFASNPSGRERWVTVTAKQTSAVGKAPIGVINNVMEQIDFKKLDKAETVKLKKTCWRVRRCFLDAMDIVHMPPQWPRVLISPACGSRANGSCMVLQILLRYPRPLL